MRRTFVRIGLALALAAVMLVGVTVVALEGTEVATLRTITPAGDVRETRVWIADADGAWWVEAGTPEREFLADIVDEPAVEVVRGGEPHRCTAVADFSPAGHARIRGLLAERYGWADRWVGMLVDTRRSVAIRLEER